ncbi:nucleotidyltransferase [Bacillus piscicola]|uniref:nucleotidyltransferase n=1 Tax=Bacillus piscicola TaxID=1632684 RepID=UPI001F08AB69|nr:nucleotidyltransferase [Bacillus piscicola]
MKAVGLIVEYNPFHNGHFYHIHSSKEKTNADVVVCVMSGYFLQRGEPALLPRRVRTMMALEGGADLVVELPYIFSSQHASWFARGAVSILSELGVDTLCFGSEHGDVYPFLELAKFLQNHEKTYNSLIKEYSSKGLSYPNAAAQAFSALEPEKSWPDLTKPNNILGFHYVRALRELHSSVQPETITRKQAGYHDVQISEHEIASATSIRRSLINEKMPPSAIAHTIPETTRLQIERFLKHGDQLYEWERFYPYLQEKILASSLEYLARIYEAEEGLEHRFVSHIKQQPSFHDFMKACKTKRYTWTRLQRLAVHLLTGTEKQEATTALSPGKADHIRLLGMNKTGQAYLNKVKKHVGVPLLAKMTKRKTAQQKLDERAALAYYMPLSPSQRILKWKEEYELPPVILS